MKFTLSWLKDYLDTTATADEICDTLTAIGLELETFEDQAATFSPFTVAEITDAHPHPDADKLQILTVKTATHNDIQVVCGAPNARKGLRGIFAPSGTYIPGLDVTLKTAKIRGIESNGMMVSEKEMCLSEDHDGIIDLPTAMPLGTGIAEIYGLDDPIFEIGLTPNRGDCAGVYGIARDLAAAGLGTLKKPDAKPAKTHNLPTVTASIDHAEDRCAHVLTREINGLTNGPSPAWLQQRLKAIGLRPISALVDITNYITHSFARPMHAFDADTLSGPLRVSLAQNGDTLQALDNKTYTLSDQDLGIYDNTGLLSIAGIVGGEKTGCTEKTTRSVLEMAYFDPASIARTGRSLGAISDARYRFERGIDPAFTRPALEIATHLITKLCGDENTQVSEIAEAGSPPETERRYSYDPALMPNLIGVDVPADEQVACLQSLGFTVEGAMSKQGPYAVIPPSWRPDILGAEDLTEEIIRLEGLDKIEARSVTADAAVPAVAETPTLAAARKSRTALATRGLNECLTWSFLSEQDATAFGLTHPETRAALTLQNPISSELNVMRPAIIPNLIRAALRNSAQGYPNVALFEVGPVFSGTAPTDQKTVASAVRSGNFTDNRHWTDPNATRAVDLYDAKADAFAILNAIGGPSASAQITRDAPSFYHPGRSATIRLGKTVLGHFGELHPTILDQLGMKHPCVACEITFDALPPARNKGTEKPYLERQTLQPVRKDFAFITSNDIASLDLIKAVKAADKTLIADVVIFDIYAGKGVEDNHKSLAVAVTLQPKTQSLTDKDLEAVTQKIITTVAKKTGATLRG